MAGARGPRTAGGMGVASELARIRGYFDRVRPDLEPGGSGADADAPAPPPPAETPDGDAWAKGTRVRSPRFGRGVILASTGRGDGLTYTVRFETGEKRIVARFGMLEKEG
jgi:DNA helicase-2/ATP-dependent DNA helicase PcrA